MSGEKPKDTNVNPGVVPFGDFTVPNHEGKLKSVLKNTYSEDFKIKTKKVSWHEDKNLTQIYYFELDPTERAFVARQVGGENQKSIIEWKMVKIDFQTLPCTPEIRSFQRKEQLNREMEMPPFFLPLGSELPDTPAEADDKKIFFASPRIIPQTSSDNVVHDHRNFTFPVANEMELRIGVEAGTLSEYYGVAPKPEQTAQLAVTQAVTHPQQQNGMIPSRPSVLYPSSSTGVTSNNRPFATGRREDVAVSTGEHGYMDAGELGTPRQSGADRHHHCWGRNFRGRRDERGGREREREVDSRRRRERERERDSGRGREREVDPRRGRERERDSRRGREREVDSRRRREREVDPRRGRERERERDSRRGRERERDSGRGREQQNRERNFKNIKQNQRTKPKPPTTLSITKNVPCKFYNIGKCIKGSGCSFLHPDPSEAPMNSNRGGSIPAPIAGCRGTGNKSSSGRNPASFDALKTVYKGE